MTWELSLSLCNGNFFEIDLLLDHSQNLAGIAAQLTQMATEVVSKAHYDPSPMKLQMGDVTHAIGDVMGAYEDMIAMLPRVHEGTASVLANMGRMESDMMKQASQMVETYRCLSDMTSGIPELQRAAFEGYGKTLREEFKVSIDPTDEKNLIVKTEELKRIKIDMLSMAQERVVLDVLTRDTVNSALQARRAMQGAASSGRGRGVAVVSPAGKPYKVLSPSASSPATSAPQNLDSPIFIPQFVPSSSSSSAAASSQPAKAGVVTPPSANRLPPKYGRAVGGGTLVPNLQHGSTLPIELRDLRLPTTDALAFDANRPKRRKRKADMFGPFAKTVVDRVEQTEQQLDRLRDQIAESARKFGKVQERELKKIKLTTEALEKQQEDRERELFANFRQVLNDAMAANTLQNSEVKQQLREMAEQLLKGRDMSALQRLPRQESVHGKYKVLSVSAPPIPPPSAPRVMIAHHTPRPQSPSRQTPMVRMVSPPPKPAAPVVRAAAPMAPAPPAAMSNPFLPSDRVYHVTLDTEEVEAPPAPPAPVVPHTVVDAPAAAAPAAATAPSVTVIHNGVEKELIDLIHNLVETNSSTMNGNQALLLALIQKLSNEKEAPAAPQSLTSDAGTAMSRDFSAEVVVDRGESQPVVEEVVELAPESTDDGGRRRNTYNTCIGEVLMEGDLMHGPYSIETKPHTAPVFERAKVHTAFTNLADQPKQGPRLRVVAGPDLMQQLTAIKAPVEKPPPEEPKLPDTAAELLKLLLSGRVSTEQVTPDFIAKAVQDGVNKGVKDALGFLENVPPDEEVTFGRHAKRYHRQDYEVFLSKAAKPRAVVDGRDCSLYKMVRTAGREDLGDNRLVPQGLVRIDQKDPLREREDEEVARRDPISISNKRLVTEEEILRDVHNSKRHVEALLDHDLCSSFDDSLSLTEDAAALLGEDKVEALYRPSFRLAARPGMESVDSAHSLVSREGENDYESHRMLYRSKLTRDVVDLVRDRSEAQARLQSSVDSGEGGEEHWYTGDPHESVEALAAGSPAVLGAGPPLASARAKFKPLVSRVLDHAATEDVVYRRELASAFSAAASRAVNAFEKHGAYSDEESVSGSDDAGSFMRHLKEKVKHKPRRHDDANDVDGAAADEARWSTDDDRARDAADDLGEAAEPHSVSDMIDRHRQYSAKGVEARNTMFAANHLPAEYPAGSSRTRPHRSQLEKDAEKIASQAGRSQNTNRLLVNPHQVIDVQRGLTKASGSAGLSPRPARAPLTSVSSGSFSSAGSMPRRPADSFDRSMISVSSTSSLDTHLSASTVSTPRPVNAGAASSAKGRKSAGPSSSRRTLADQHMISLLGKERSLGHTTQSARNENLIANYVGDRRGSSQAARGGRPSFAGVRLDESLSSRDDDSIPNVDASTDSSVAAFARGPSRLLTVGVGGFASKAVDKSAAGRIKSWR